MLEVTVGSLTTVQDTSIGDTHRDARKRARRHVCGVGANRATFTGDGRSNRWMVA